MKDNPETDLEYCGCIELAEFLEERRRSENEG